MLKKAEEIAFMNGYNKIAKNMVVQCDKCKSQGELPIKEPTIEELNEMAKYARLQ